MCNLVARVFRPTRMRHLVAVAGAGLVLVLAAGCAQQQGTASTGGNSPSLATSTPAVTPAPPHTATLVPPVPGTTPPGVRPPAGAVVVPGNRVDARALPYTFPRLVWTDRGGTNLGFEGEVGGCLTSRAVVEEQNATEVTVRLIQQEPGTGEHSCPMFVRYKPMTVHLAAPLGDRTVRLQMSIIRG